MRVTAPAEPQRCSRLPPVFADRLPLAIFQVSEFINLKAFAIITMYLKYDHVLRKDHRIKTTQPISLILVSFFSEDKYLMILKMLNLSHESNGKFALSHSTTESTTHMHNISSGRPAIKVIGY